MPDNKEISYILCFDKKKVILKETQTTNNCIFQILWLS